MSTYNDFINNVDDEITVLSNSFRFYDEDIVQDKIGFITIEYFIVTVSIGSRQILNPVTYSILQKDHERFIEISKKTFNAFFDDENHHFDAERLRYNMLSDLKNEAKF